VAINCAALPETLLESELFGHEKGAFTGAVSRKKGKFELASQGTLLLDEISEMDVSLQVKLLRVLANGEYQPLGATRTLKTDARVIAATNADLKRAIAEGRFREDLYFRINVVAVELPPLRDRPEDIPLLVEHFIEKVRAKIRKPITRATPRTLSLLQQYSFPGNVRELQSVLEHACVLCPGGTVRVEHLPASWQRPESEARGNLAQGLASEEMRLIQEALELHHGHREAAARELGMHKTTLYRKIRRLGIVLPQSDGRKRAGKTRP
jgi:transcriptional regulator with PAS, ATPase and Fis domain